MFYEIGGNNKQVQTAIQENVGAKRNWLRKSSTHEVKFEQVFRNDRQ